MKTGYIVLLAVGGVVALSYLQKKVFEKPLIPLQDLDYLGYIPTVGDAVKTTQTGLQVLDLATLPVKIATFNFGGAWDTIQRATGW